MSDIVWLASYPKSGNTWFRMLIANLSARDNRPVDINDLAERSGIASGRGAFDAVTLIDSGLLTHDEADRLRPRVYEVLAADDPDAAAIAGEVIDAPPGPTIMKAHDAYTLTSDDEPLMCARGVIGAIVVVRDPRDVAPSLANHMGVSIDEAIAFMANPSACFCGTVKGQPNQLRQRLLAWHAHVASWLNQRDLPIHVVRYEDLASATVATFRAAMAFAGRPITEDEAARAISLAAFANLQEQERQRGFSEWQSRRSGQFFRKGQAGSWREELTETQVETIERDHGVVMDRLGYVRADRTRPGAPAWDARPANGRV